ncbi:hypothetical protein GO495_09525 [Chitinophaga oryziterrae]|uniref:Uncharacterized protein n=1 Tax=Chitinophaga oryziterrae TaxID=1031224 RepID=A0A6N8J6F5_9BACT|nr:hypothetical protein [Chitinophaga oryziterrae]MVT40817.1 hypothetical protein [Chitinophaga oryziterrae]
MKTTKPKMKTSPSPLAIPAADYLTHAHQPAILYPETVSFLANPLQAIFSH